MRRFNQGTPLALRALRSERRIMWMQRRGLLVLMGATSEGKKELIAVVDGYRESVQSWTELLLDLKQRGLSETPLLAVGDGSLGFWAALRKVFAKTSEPRCWPHKTGTVLNKMPKNVQPKAKVDLRESWQAETRQAANQAFDHFWKNTGRSTTRHATAWRKIEMCC